MTTDTLTPALESPAPAAPAAAKNSLSLTSLILSIVSIPLGMAPVAIVGIVLGFVAYRGEPGARTLSTFGILTGFLSIFGWVLLGFAALLFAVPFAFGAWAFAGF